LKFNCIANDTVGNTNNLSSSLININSNTPELFLSDFNIFINKTPELERENILITANITNYGCSNANNLLVGFYNGDKSLEGTSIENITDTVNNRSSKNFSISWQVEIGSRNIFIYADNNNFFVEENESNNIGNKTIYLQAWQKMYGNTTINKILSNSLKENITFWLNHSNIQGNIFISDSESNINWYKLQSLGKDILNQTTSNDFSELDTILSMTNLNDSIYNTFTISGTPKSKENLTFFKKIINNIPTINSTENNNNFLTGILWDTSDDTNNEFDSTEKEDIVFIARVNKNALGSYGIYDYEARIPARLREYDETDTQDIFFYYEIN
jgi:hypothetical protein